MMLAELIFGPNEASGTEFFGQFLGLETENLPKLGILNRIGSYGTENAGKGSCGLWSS